MPFSMISGTMLRRGQELEEIARRRALRRIGADACDLHDVVLHLGRQRPDERHALDGEQLADRGDADLRFALGDGLAGQRAARDALELVLQRIGEAEAIDQADEVDAALAARRKGDRLRGEQRLLEGFDRAHVGLRRAGAHHHAHAGLREHRAGIGDDLALLDEGVDLRRGEDGDIERRAPFDLFSERGGEAVAHHELVAGRLLVLRAEHVDHRMVSVGADQPDLGGAAGGGRGRRHGERRRRGERCELHGPIPPSSFVAGSTRRRGRLDLYRR